MELQSLSTSPSTPAVPNHSAPQPLSLSQLLQCSFDPPSSGDARRFQLRHEPPHGERRAAKLAYRMAPTYGCGFRERDIRDLLAPQDGPLKSIKGGFLFHYRRRPVGCLPGLAFSPRAESNNTHPLPVAVWTEFALIDELRCKAMRVGHAGRRRNPPVQRLDMLRWKAVTPVEPLHDPCILALLITVAQGQQIVVTQEQGQPDRPSYRSHVIWTDFDDQEHVHVFSADISSSFLYRFDFPGFVPPAPAFISIRHTTAPFKPYKTLYSRLLALILPDPHDTSRNDGKRKGETTDDGPRKMVPGQRHEDMDQSPEHGQSTRLAQQSQDEG
ncbi:hypothetical protein C8A01DRAFT_49296 [Parachaetomium inaequale]|uniref:Uncharacterized protein n=1 Tax=Parachaetomium inaequale TaxID=2588326 RepID=A0AAN6PE28_9PEZI|nr:hypothetical protein C8A01DRAFT_49296 [Parachaetomium inaequale]